VALKSIDARGQAFSQSMSTHGSEVARTITSAGDMATGAVAKSLKDLEQSSRSAIDQSRQVSIAAVTEMQETSKILRTDTVALFERLREGTILLQEVLAGAHHRPPHHRPRPAAVALHRPARRIARRCRRARSRYRARGGGNRGRRFCRDQPPVRGGARCGRKRAAADPQCDERPLPAEQP